MDKNQNPFDILSAMNIDDIANNTANVALSNTITAIDMVDAGYLVQLGVSPEVGQRVFHSNLQGATPEVYAFLVVADIAAYRKKKEEMEQ